jgi:DNA-binding winged helix-turn-helix (wHTH) protein
MMTDPSKIFSFDDVKVELRTGEVFKAGAAVALEPKVFKLLVFLIENRDRLVEKEEILDVLWKDVNVTENALASAIAKLRRTLGDDSKTGKYIQTLHARGYRFVANLEVENGSARDGQTKQPSATLEGRKALRLGGRARTRPLTSAAKQGATFTWRRKSTIC